LSAKKLTHFIAIVQWRWGRETGGRRGSSGAGGDGLIPCPTRALLQSFVKWTLVL